MSKAIINEANSFVGLLEASRGIIFANEPHYLSEYAHFCFESGTLHHTSSPRYPGSNSFIEC